MSARFSPGDVVVCRNARGPARKGWLAPTQLVNGAFYRVRRVWRDPDWGMCVVLADIEANTVNGGFLATRFRKIEAPKTEIADRIRACKPVKVSA